MGTVAKSEPIDWEELEFRQGVAPGGGVLIASGQTPTQVRGVRLEPDENPTGDYFTIRLLAEQADAEPQVITPFREQLPVQAREGFLGFEVIGKTKRHRVSLKPFHPGS